ncbi:hypothetical protein [Brumimicrobium mesophilum]|uniref:hypothetical protein n=1 Tax=Brumimicrobium mesophilum TaxID=392717 RepID=UPI000D14196B|nr:hypothetical protein [Brumimicrobium mesophilum]
MKPTTELTYKLNDDSLDALRSAIGETLYIVFAPTLSISASNNLVSSSSFSISLEKGFLNLWTNELDGKSLYWQMHVDCNSKPRDIKYEKDKQFKRYELHEPSDIKLKSSSKLKSIDIYSDRDTQTFNAESSTLYSTIFDHSIVFNLENGDTFCVSVDIGMPDSTVIGCDANSIQILLEDKTLRLTI